MKPTRPALTLRATRVANTLFWATFGLYSLHASLPHNALHLPLEAALEPVAWAPQGWAFFTRDANEETIQVYTHEGTSWRLINDAPNASPANWFGASRRARAFTSEAATLLHDVTTGAWHDCPDGTEQCADEATSVQVVNPIPRPAICGDVAFASQRGVPWAWVGSSRPVHMPVRVLRVEVKC